jgi:phosphoribosylformimino-5-aminoimidazole carboxamide ribotide isomerase
VHRPPPGKGETNRRRQPARRGRGTGGKFRFGQSPAWFAETFRNDQLSGGHVIKLGPGNDAAAREALAAWPGGLQIGGGICEANAKEWLDAGASHVIVTSALFDANGKFLAETLDQLVKTIGADKLVIDLSCRRTPVGWTVAMNRWQTLTELESRTPRSTGWHRIAPSS